MRERKVAASHAGEVARGRGNRGSPDRIGAFEELGRIVRRARDLAKTRDLGHRPLVPQDPEAPEAGPIDRGGKDPDGRAHVAADQPSEIAAHTERADETPFLPVDPRRELRATVAAARTLAEEPGHEEEIPGAREQHGDAREERVAQRVPNPAESQLVATLPLREHRDDLPGPTLVSLGIVEPRENGRRHGWNLPGTRVR